MTRREELLQLAARVEAAQGADRELDESIYRALGYWWDSDEAEWCAPDSPRSAEGNDVPAFTASLDAAASLVPAGFDWCLEVGLLGVSAGVERGGSSPHVSWPGQTHNAATPALALTAAALRAMAEDTPDA